MGIFTRMTAIAVFVLTLATALQSAAESWKEVKNKRADDVYSSSLAHGPGPLFGLRESEDHNTSTPSSLSVRVASAVCRFEMNHHVLYLYSTSTRSGMVDPFQSSKPMFSMTVSM